MSGDGYRASSRAAAVHRAAQLRAPCWATSKHDHRACVDRCASGRKESRRAAAPGLRGPMRLRAGLGRTGGRDHYHSPKKSGSEDISMYQAFRSANQVDTPARSGCEFFVIRRAAAHRRVSSSGSASSSRGRPSREGLSAKGTMRHVKAARPCWFPQSLREFASASSRPRDSVRSTLLLISSPT